MTSDLAVAPLAPLGVGQEQPDAFRLSALVRGQPCATLDEME
jgi:hypothetical protein